MAPEQNEHWRYQVQTARMGLPAGIRRVYLDSEVLLAADADLSELADLTRERDEAIEHERQTRYAYRTAMDNQQREILDLRQRVEQAEQERDAMQCRAEAAESDWQEAEHTLDLIHAADQRAIQLWRRAHPCDDLRMPGSVKLSVWLMEEVDRLRHALEAIDAEANLSTDPYAHLERCAALAASALGDSRADLVAWPDEGDRG